MAPSRWITTALDVGDPAEHPSPEALFSFAKGGLEPEERERTGDHISVCRPCAELVMIAPEAEAAEQRFLEASSRRVDGPGSRRAIGSWGWLTAALAAGLVGVVVGSYLGQSGSTAPDAGGPGVSATGRVPAEQGSAKSPFRPRLILLREAGQLGPKRLPVDPDSLTILLLVPERALPTRNRVVIRRAPGEAGGEIVHQTHDVRPGDGGSYDLLLPQDLAQEAGTYSIEVEALDGRIAARFILLLHDLRED